VRVTALNAIHRECPGHFCAPQVYERGRHEEPFEPTPILPARMTAMSVRRAFVTEPERARVHPGSGVSLYAAIKRPRAASSVFAASRALEPNTVRNDRVRVLARAVCGVHIAPRSALEPA
jgi:hypothetical protein